MSNREHIDQFMNAGQHLRQAVAGLSEKQLDAQPISGTWSIREIVVHLADSDAVGIERMKRIIAMERPLMLGYDENAFMRRLFPHEQPVEENVQLFDLNRRLLSITLSKLPEEAFERWGVHNERGRVTLTELVADYNRHFEHHLGFIRRKRALVSSGA